MYNAMRRCVPIASLLLGSVIYAERTTPPIIGAIILITAGTITAATGDLDFDFKVCFIINDPNSIIEKRATCSAPLRFSPNPSTC